MTQNKIVKEPLLDAWVMLHQFGDSLEKCEQKVFDQFDFMVQEYQVLRSLEYLEGHVTPTAITNYLDKNRNYITFILDRLEKKGLVKRIRDMDDRRSLRLVVTPKGEKQYRLLSGPAEELPKELLSVLSPKEIQSLDKILRKIIIKTYKYRSVKNKGIAGTL
jgi:DNA-binding MarR family transcriptional regulator